MFFVGLALQKLTFPGKVDSPLAHLVGPDHIGNDMHHQLSLCNKISEGHIILWQYFFLHIYAWRQFNFL